jgi:hypothetical protein
LIPMIRTSTSQNFTKNKNEEQIKIGVGNYPSATTFPLKEK